MGRASAAAVAAAVAGPDYGAAVDIINGRIATAKTKQSKASGEASAAWKDIEKMGLHRGGAQMGAKVMAMEDEDERIDLLRTFQKLLEAAGIGIPQDLVDQAEGKPQEPVVPTAKVVAPTEVPKGPPGDTDLAGDDGDGDGDDADQGQQEASDGEPPVQVRKPRGRANSVTSIAEARERAKKHLSGEA